MKKIILKIILLFSFLLFAVSHAQQGKLSLDECVKIALENNPDLIRGEFTVKIAGRDVTIALSNFLPKISASMGYTHVVTGPRSIIFTDPGTGLEIPIKTDKDISYYSRTGLTVSQSIIKGGYNIFNYRQSRALKKSAEYNFEDTKQNIIYVVKERYYNLLAAEKLLEVAKETLLFSEESYKRAEAMFEVGKAPKSDVLKAKVQLENDRSSFIEAQNNLAVARASLNHILGFDVDHKIEVVDNLDIPEVEISYRDALENAFTSHPALFKRRFDIQASKAGVGMAVSTYLPSLSAYFDYSWTNEDFSKISSVLKENYTWYAGISLSVPIFSGFSRFAQLSKAKLMLRSNQEALEQAKKDVALETKQAYFAVKQAKKKIEVTKDAVEAAQEDLRLNSEKYRLGSGTMLELIDAQVSVARAKSDHIQAMYEYKKAIARLQKAMGKLER